MPDWLVNLIIGILSLVLGFISGFFTKTQLIKNKQIIKGNNNHINNGDFKNEYREK